VTTQSWQASPAIWHESQSMTMHARLGTGSDTAALAAWALDAAVAGGFPIRTTELRTRDHFDAIAGRAPAAANHLDLLGEFRSFLDLDVSGQCRMPVLARAPGAHHIESREVSAVTTAKAGSIVRQLHTHVEGTYRVVEASSTVTPAP